jgi:transcriptional regulator with XRE-family HTH domain
VKVINDFGKNLRELRKKRNLSQENLADECGLHRTYLGGLERGERNPTLTTMKRIADALHVSLDELLKDIS